MSKVWESLKEIPLQPLSVSAAEQIRHREAEISDAARHNKIFP